MTQYEKEMLEHKIRFQVEKDKAFVQGVNEVLSATIR